MFSGDFSRPTEELSALARDAHCLSSMRMGRSQPFIRSAIGPNLSLSVDRLSAKRYLVVRNSQNRLARMSHFLEVRRIC